MQKQVRGGLTIIMVVFDSKEKSPNHTPPVPYRHMHTLCPLMAVLRVLLLVSICKSSC